MDCVSSDILSFFLYFFLEFLGGWDWEDKTAVDFTYWRSGEPNNYGETGETTVEMYTDGGWNDQFAYETRGYVCKKHKSMSDQNLDLFTVKLILFC